MSKHNLRRPIVRQLRHAARGTKRMASRMRKGDAAALHDIRVQVRTINSVLQPFIDLPHVKPLRRALARVKSWGRKSNQVRDLEAQLELIEELLPPPYPGGVVDYLARAKEKLQQRRASLAQSKTLDKLPRRIAKLAKTADACLKQHDAASLRAAPNFACAGLFDALRTDCGEASVEPERQHKARIRIKRLRYLIESFHSSIDERYCGVVDEARLAQQKIGRLRDWQNLCEAMAGEPVMARWLAGFDELEKDLARQAQQALQFLERRLVASPAI